MADVNLSKAVRSNLLSLQSTAANMAKTQNRLATGLKVNSALDNPTNFFTAASLNSRAGDMANLLDSMANGIQTIEAADNGLSSITKTVESMQSTLRQARQDKSFQTLSYSINLGDTPTGAEELSVSGGAFATGLDASVALTTGAAATTSAGEDITAATALEDLGIADGDTFDIDYIDANGDAATYTYTVADAAAESVQDLMDDLNGTTDITLSASIVNGKLSITSTAAELDDGAFTISGDAATAIGFGTDEVSAIYTAKSVDTLVAEINNASSDFAGKVRASNDNGKLRLQNLSTQDLNVDGASASGVIDGTTTDASTIGGNDVRANLAKQFNELRDQLDKFADDASFNGINLLRGDVLKLTFNETGTSTIDIQAKDGEAINSTSLDITYAEEEDLDTDAAIDTRLDTLKSALDGLRSQASAFGSNLSVVENRQDFTKKMINTLETGAANLTLADTNEEAANLLALQTRQQLSSTALSMASQADQAVLRLF